MTFTEQCFEELCISAAQLVVLIYENRRFGPHWGFLVSPASVEALQSDYTAMVCHDLKVQVRTGRTSRGRVAWIERQAA